MAMKGSLLVTAEAMELASIPAESRDQAVDDFHRMKTEAERRHDQFYALQELFSHQFSYGDFYNGLIYRAWPDFHADKVLASISQRTYQLIHAFSQCVMMFMPLNSEADFQQKEQPHAHTGYCNPQGLAGYVGNMPAWEEWHREWYRTHPQEIDWSHATNDWLPRQDLVLGILRRELKVKFVEEGMEPEEAELAVATIGDESVAHEFHDRVMKHKGGVMGGYALEIGGEICRCNYYNYESELSDMERQYAKSMRQIYSIVNKNGKEQFISIDFGHGMFEFHDENGEHQGEFRFNGTLNSGIEADHGLKSLAQWRKKTGRL